jgi:hypothetical protein
MYYDLNQSDHINNFLQATDRLIKDINNFINCFKASLGNDHEPAKIWERQLGYSKKEFEKLKNKFNNLDSSTNYDESVSTENFDINDSSHLLQFEFTKI